MYQKASFSFIYSFPFLAKLLVASPAETYYDISAIYNSNKL